ncbi:hypothetical protein V1478_014773 [Vespula squamosa]|uniref:Uncharacterized protein n=1 Tax=Vespula squamosa TaxID=30214 RepID=A0ABD2A5M7_VESSQ
MRKTNKKEIKYHVEENIGTIVKNYIVVYPSPIRFQPVIKDTQFENLLENTDYNQNMFYNQTFIISLNYFIKYDHFHHNDENQSLNSVLKL